MKLTEKIAIMQHFANGGAVEYTDHFCGVWYDIEDPLWDWCKYSYRIKVDKPKVDWDSIDPKWNYCILNYNEVYFTVEKPIFTNIWNIHGDYCHARGIFKIDPNLKSKDSLVSRNGD